MKTIKNLLLASTVVCFFSAFLNLIYFIDGVCKPQNIMAIFVIYHIVAIASNLVLGVFILILYKKPNNSLASNINLFKWLCIATILCCLLAGILVCYTYYLLTVQLQNNSQKSGTNSIEVDGMEIIEDKRMAKYIDELNHLEEAKESGIISQEQYEILKNKIINNYVKGE